MERDLTERISARIIRSNLIGKISTSLDTLMNRGLGAAAMRPLKIFLNGTWVGHPLHPMLTDIPIGAWTLTILLDLIGLLFGFPQLGLASSITAFIGVAGALAAAATGLADWMGCRSSRESYRRLPRKCERQRYYPLSDFASDALGPPLAARMGNVYCRFGGIPPGNDRRLSRRSHGVLQGGHDQSQRIPNWSG